MPIEPGLALALDEWAKALIEWWPEIATVRFAVVSHIGDERVTAAITQSALEPAHAAGTLPWFR